MGRKKTGWAEGKWSADVSAFPPAARLPSGEGWEGSGVAGARPVANDKRQNRDQRSASEGGGKGKTETNGVQVKAVAKANTEVMAKVDVDVNA